MKIFVAIFVLVAVAGVYCDCGCLKCSKNLQVVSAPAAPVKVIYRGNPCNCARQIPYSIETPVIARPKPLALKNYCYKCQAINLQKQPKPAPLYSYNYQVEVPQQQKTCTKYLVGLVASPDRVVLPAPGQSCSDPTPCGPGPIFENINLGEDEDYEYSPYVTYTGQRYGPSLGRSKRALSTSAEENIERNIREIFFNEKFEDEPAVVDFGLRKFLEKYKSSAPKLFRTSTERPSSGGPNFEDLTERQQSDLRRTLLDYKTRRQLFRPEPTRVPAINLGDIPIRLGWKPQSRSKRDIYRLTEIDDDENEVVAKPKLSDQFFDNLNWDDIIPQIPLFYFVNAPVRMLSHFDKLRQHVDPIVECVPRVLTTSHDYIRDFGRKFKRSAAKFARLFFIGFDRYARSTEDVKGLQVLSYKRNDDGTVDMIVFNNNSKFSDLALVYENFNADELGDNAKIYLKLDEGKSREKRDVQLVGTKKIVSDAILNETGAKSGRKRRLVNPTEEFDVFEDELHQMGEVNSFLGDKFLKAHRRRDVLHTKTPKRQKRALLNPLPPNELLELFIDKFGLNDDETVGAPIQEDIFEKHFNSIPKLKEHFESQKSNKRKVYIEKIASSENVFNSPSLDFLKKTNDEHVGASITRIVKNAPTSPDVVDFDPAKNLLVIKKEITRTLTEIQTLIHTDFTKDLQISQNLLKLQTLLKTLIVDWRTSLKSPRARDVSMKLNILNYLKELEKLKDVLVRDASLQLLSKNEYNRKSNIKTLVNLYKLQTAFLNIVEDFGEKIKMGAKFHPENEAIYINTLSKISLIPTTFTHQLEAPLKSTRDDQLKNCMGRLEKLRALLDHNEITEEIREDINNNARIVQELSQVRALQKGAIKDLNAKIKRRGGFRRELKAVVDLEKQIGEYEEKLLPIKNDSVEVVEESEEVVAATKKDKADKLDKQEKINLKEKIEEMVKNFEAKRDAWLEKNKKALEKKKKKDS